MDWPHWVRISLFIWLFYVSGSSSGALATSVSQTQLDFPSVLARVREASHALKRARAQVDAAEFSRIATELQSYPNLQVSNSLAWQQSSSSLKQQHTLALSATLWDFGRQKAQELRAVSQLRVSQAQLSEADELLKNRTARFYVSMAAADSVLKLALEQSKNAESKLQTVTSAYKRGERPQTDVVKLKVEAGRAALFAARARDEFSLLTAQLQLLSQAETAQVNRESTWSLKGLRERSAEDWELLFSGWEKRSSQAATLAKLAANEQILRAELESLESESYPVLGANASALGAGALTPFKPDALAQINLQYTLPLADVRGNKRSALRARINEAQLAQMEEQKLRLDKFVQSKIRLEGLGKNLQLQRQQIETLLDYQKLVRARYTAGRASLLELTTTEDDLLANRLEVARLLASIYTAAIDAAEAMGQPNFDDLF